MDRPQQDILTRLKSHWQNKEFNEGLAILEEYPEDNKETAYLRQKFADAKIKEIDAILNDFEDALKRKDRDAAANLLGKAKNLDDRDARVRAAQERLQNALLIAEQETQLSGKKKRAGDLLKSPGSIKDIDTAVRLLEETAAASPGEIDAESLLKDAQRKRGDFLKEMGLVATLDQAEEYEEALTKLNDLIQRGRREFIDDKGNRYDIFEYRSLLEKRVQNFADQKAAQYLKKAEGALEQEQNPRLALKYIETGLGLPGIPKNRRDALNDLKIKADQDLEEFIKVEAQVEKAHSFMNEQAYEQAISILKSVPGRFPQSGKVGTYLDLAAQGLRDKVFKESRLAIIRIESGLCKENLLESREKLLDVIGRLEYAGEEFDQLRLKSRELLQEIDRRIHNEAVVREAVNKAEAAMASNNLAAAKSEIQSLDKDLQERPEIRNILAELNRRGDIEEALNAARRAFENGQFETARELILDLRMRAPGYRDVDKLDKEIDAVFTFNKGLDAFQEGLLKEARNAFQRLVDNAAPQAQKAGEYLQKIADLSEQDQQAKQAYRTAKKYFETGDFKEVCELLAEFETTPSSVKDRILELRAGAREKWRSQLNRQIKSCLKKNDYNDMVNLLKDLKDVQGIEDSALIHDAYKKYYIHQARIAVGEKEWARAYDNWLEAQKYDISDPQIQQGLQIARKEKTLEEVGKVQNEAEVIPLLESIIDAQAGSLNDLDFKVEERLYQAYLRSEEFNRALTLAGKRMNLDPRFSSKARIIHQLCLKLNKSKEKFHGGAFKESLELLKECSGCGKYPEYEGILEELSQRRSRQIIDTLLKEARDLEHNEESEVRIILKYKELLWFEPDHKPAKEKYARLFSDFKANIKDAIREAIRLRDDEGATEEDIDYLIKQINDMIAIANPKEKTKLNPHQVSLSEKLQVIRSQKKKLILIEALLARAKENGDFGDVYQVLGDLMNSPYSKNPQIRTVVNEIKTAKDRRKKCLEIANRIEQAFSSLNFADIEKLCEDLKRLDEDDEFGIQRNRLRFEDTFVSQKIAFDELKGWARSRRLNLECLTAWFNEGHVDTGDIEDREKELRKIDESDPDCYEKLARGLETLGKVYRNRTQALLTPPDTALSKPAENITREAEKWIKKLNDKAQKLDEEAREIRQDDEKVKELEKEASALVNAGKYPQAEAVVDEALSISPNHPVLLHYKKLIKERA